MRQFSNLYNYFSENHNNNNYLRPLLFSHLPSPTRVMEEKSIQDW
jgi:hypothetical protein